MPLQLTRETQTKAYEVRRSMLIFQKTVRYINIINNN